MSLEESTHELFVASALGDDDWYPESVAFVPEDLEDAGRIVWRYLLARQVVSLVYRNGQELLISPYPVLEPDGRQMDVRVERRADAGGMGQLLTVDEDSVLPQLLASELVGA